MRRTKRPLSASLEEWPVLAVSLGKSILKKIQFVANIYPASPGGIGAR